jgi:hypothetical protein
VAQELVELRDQLPAVERLVDAHELAVILGVDPGWVRSHAADLGAIRLGGGPKAPQRFDPGQAISRLEKAHEGPRPDQREPGKSKASSRGRVGMPAQPRRRVPLLEEKEKSKC